MKTLLLDVVRWDLTVDVTGNIAVASEPYAIAQDAASAIRLFAGELWYDTRQGVPYWEQILGKSPPLALIKAKLEAAAMTVPEVVSAKCYISSFTNRGIKGQVQITDSRGQTSAASF